jgi:Asp-tRNA(Asn)/Glu-tRNA(Gln) amidotransferase A subunit family amidase
VDPADYLRYLAHNDTHLFSVAGLPALSVPAGFEHDLPIGVQVAAPAWREHVVLAVGALVERCLGGVAGYAAAGTA